MTDSLSKDSKTRILKLMKRFYTQIEFGNRTFIILDYRYRFLIPGVALVLTYEE